MSSTYKKIDCKCGCYEQTHTNTFVLWDYHTNSTCHIYYKGCDGKFRKIISLDIDEIEALRTLLTDKDDKLQWPSSEEMQEIEKVRFCQ